MLKPVGNDFIKSYRVRNSLKALERVRDAIGEEAYERFRALLHYRLRGEDFDRSPVGVKVALAFSGGSDSTASLKVLRWAGFDVVPVMARLPQMREPVLVRAQLEGAVIVDVPGYLDVIGAQVRKRAPICGRCHSMVMGAVKGYARERGIKIVASGDLLTFGSLSIYPEGDMVNLNFPAFLAMDKREAISLLGRKYSLGFGCPLWKAASREARVLKRFGIQRVMRELNAGAIDGEIAKALILDILKP
ncbi:ATPase [Palaeococcus ferrophilus]|uniref:ATPase n=1 Tax=Palaeococcus ferrophilus TaxID=83868 RepID=UPI00064FB166|nr:ATPase [Palaeococcus ferrophilus]